MASLLGFLILVVLAIGFCITNIAAWRARHFLGLPIVMLNAFATILTCIVSTSVLFYFIPLIESLNSI